MEAALEVLHDELEVAVRLLRRRAQRAREIGDARESLVAKWNLPVSAS
jgi:hypothetical protein